MAIYGVGYRRLEYRPTSQWQRLWPVARNEVRQLFRRWPGIVAFIICLGPALVSFVILMIHAGLMQLGFDPAQMRANPVTNPESIDFYFLPTIGWFFGYVVFLMLSALVGCRSIAKDRESQALEIYWTRGIGPWGYFFAKWLGSFLLVGTVFVLAPFTIWLVGVLLAPDWGMLERTLEFVPRMMLAFVVFTALLTYVAVGFSALAPTANSASVLWLGLLLGTSTIGLVVSRAFRGEWWCKAICPWDATKRIAMWICGYTPRQDYDPAWAVLFLGIVLAGITLGVVRRMRLVEAVG